MQNLMQNLVQWFVTGHTILREFIFDSLYTSFYSSGVYYTFKHHLMLDSFVLILVWSAHFFWHLVPFYTSRFFSYTSRLPFLIVCFWVFFFITIPCRRVQRGLWNHSYIKRVVLNRPRYVWD